METVHKNHDRLVTLLAPVEGDVWVNPEGALLGVISPPHGSSGIEATIIVDEASSYTFVVFDLGGEIEKTTERADGFSEDLIAKAIDWYKKNEPRR